ncbi:hypothetical protein N657DRAFT_444994 [Parathielavia appendiculata]|uniref:Uncharacterized protein n=1 Tax=Parathielavia appendiculata TaxID=2587402 RepID=A0AAN6Z2L5_9PEZI|nr:hypothetical protein N657DRAFT_444994 [Parathielavia appendiculata]
MLPNAGREVGTVCVADPTASQLRERASVVALTGDFSSCRGPMGRNMRSLRYPRRSTSPQAHRAPCFLCLVCLACQSMTGKPRKEGPAEQPSGLGFGISTPQRRSRKRLAWLPVINPDHTANSKKKQATAHVRSDKAAVASALLPVVVRSLRRDGGLPGCRIRKLKDNQVPNTCGGSTNENRLKMPASNAAVSGAVVSCRAPACVAADMHLAALQ